MENSNETAPSAPQPVDPLDLGVWIGQAQAFSLVANRCSAAQAECLKRIHETRAYAALNLSWDQFCRERAGLSRTAAEDLIRRLDEFGAQYFHIASIVRLSPESYRLIATVVSEEGVELDGEIVPLTPENVPRIRRAVQLLREELERARKPALLPSIIDLKRRFDACFDELSLMSHHTLDASNEAAWRGMVNYGINKLRELSRRNPRVV